MIALCIAASGLENVLLEIASLEAQGRGNLEAEHSAQAALIEHVELPVAPEAREKLTDPAR